MNWFSKHVLWVVALVLTALVSPGQQGVAGRSSQAFPAYPLAVPAEHSLMAAWEKKAVLDVKLVDDMERDGNWRVTGIGQMNYTTDRAKDGKRSLRFRTSVRDTAFLALPGNHGKWNSQRFNITGQAGSSSVELRFETPQDWSAYNRISFWVYVHPTSLPRHNINLAIHNEGGISTALTTSNTHYNNNLVPGRWNHVLFEMPHLERNKVTMFSLTRELTGNNPGEDEIVTYDIDRIELQRVVADAYEGWEVAPGKISFSHVGYRPGDEKIALAGGGGSGGGRFQLIDGKGKTVFSGAAAQLVNKNGYFHQLDFSGYRRAGTYRIRYGSIVSKPFPIEEDIWVQPVFKAVNFYFCQRCGYEVPGIHKACHMDWQGIRGDVRKVINGGWHDAGDLSQGNWRSSMAVFSMMNNLEVLDGRKDAAEVCERMRSEIGWGLQYLLKTRFGDGYHIHWCRMRMFTDNVIGTMDDVIVPAENVPWENFLAAAVESRAAVLLQKSDPGMAGEARVAALDDWKAAVASNSTWDSASIEEASWGTISSLFLFKMTGEESYRRKAIAFGNLVIRCQEQHFVEGVPITGYFYTSTSRLNVIHNKHTAFEEAPMIAMAMLCREVPDGRGWIDWYSAAVLYSEYFLKRGSRIAAPYDMLPSSVYAKAELLAEKNEKTRETSLQQYNDGTHLNDGYVLRTFPIWSDGVFHGNTNVQLSKAWALAEASKLRNDGEGMKLVAEQLEWVLGRNPFGQSLMYGVGYDFAPHFAYCLKNEVGSLPVGMDCRAGDKPYWPATNSATFKEMWMEPVTRFLGAVSVYSAQDLMKQDGNKVLAGGDDWQENRSGTAGRGEGPDGGRRAKIEVRTAQPENGKVLVTMVISGAGEHDLEIKAFNGRPDFTTRRVRVPVGHSGKIQCELDVIDQNMPYVAVITADKDEATRVEVVGACGDTRLLF